MVGFYVLIGSKVAFFFDVVSTCNIHSTNIFMFQVSGDPDPVLPPLSSLKTSKVPKNRRTKSNQIDPGRVAWVDELGPRAALGEVVVD